MEQLCSRKAEILPRSRGLCEHQVGLFCVAATRLIHSSSPSFREPNLQAWSTGPLQVLPVVRVTTGNTTGAASQVFLDQGERN